jgi:type IV pilus assembly protein PilA
MRKYGKQSGFTIIELMGVVAIIGILAIIVLPSIKSYTVRAKMSEALLAFGPCRATITEVLLSGDDSPVGGQWGCEVASNFSTYVDSIQTTDTGVIVITLHGFSDGRLDSKQLTLAPLDNTGTVGGVPARWRCGSPLDNTEVPAQFLPASCRGG